MKIFIFEIIFRKISISKNHLSFILIDRSSYAYIFCVKYIQNKQTSLAIVFALNYYVIKDCINFIISNSYWPIKTGVHYVILPNFHFIVILFLFFWNNDIMQSDVTKERRNNASFCFHTVIQFPWYLLD